MESLSFIQWCLDNLNYWTITFLMMIESSFIPFPSEIVIIPAAYKAAYGELNMYLVVIFGTLGADLGAIINYYLALGLDVRSFINSPTAASDISVCSTRKKSKQPNAISTSMVVYPPSSED